MITDEALADLPPELCADLSAGRAYMAQFRQDVEAGQMRIEHDGRQISLTEYDRLLIRRKR